MCVSCGCGVPNDDHGDSRNITMEDLNQAAQAAGTTRDKVLQNIMSGTNFQSNVSSQQSSQGTQVQGSSSDQLMGSSQQRGNPGEYAPPIGQDSGTAWGQSKEMGQTADNKQQDTKHSDE